MRKRYNRNRIATIEDELLARKHQQTTASVLGTGGDGGLTVPAGPDGAVQYNDGGAFGGEAHFIWDDANDYLGLFGSGAVNTAPLYPLHIERSASADRVLAYFRNTSADDNVSAAVVVENSSVGHAGVLAQFGVTYSRVPSFADKTALYSLEGSKGLVLLPITGMTEFWLYHGAYPADAYQHVADIRSTAANVGFMPGADSAFVLGSETGPLRWADGSFDQLHVNSYLLSMSGALTVEAASAINQDLTTDAVATFAGIATPHYLGSAAAGDFLQDPASAGYTQTVAAQRIRIGWQPGSQYTIGRNVNTGYLELIGSQTGYIGYTFDGPVNLSGGLIGEYQTQSGAWADPTGTGVNGRIVTVYNSSTAPNHRVYIYSNGAWHYLNADA